MPGQQKHGKKPKHSNKRKKQKLVTDTNKMNDSIVVSNRSYLDQIVTSTTKDYTSEIKSIDKDKNEDLNKMPWRGL